MATTVAQAFLTLRQNLEITGLQAETVSTRQTNVRKVVEAGMNVRDSFLTGSYIRSTMIAPLKEADVDIFVVLNSSYFRQYDSNAAGSQAGLLDAVRRVLLKTYTKTPDISRNGQAVTIRFDDFLVDVVPAFDREGGGYLIPNAISRSWISTDPKKHVELMTAANKAHSGQLLPLVKMIKAWNKAHGKFFRSFHLEVLSLQILGRVTISDLPSALRFFFDKARVVVTQQNLDPSGHGGDVGSYINTREAVDEAVKKFQGAFDLALRAEESAARQHIGDAMDHWGRLLGDYFPTYG